ncbi:MAG TPA: peroxiredoxin [Rhodocyclaceae bacterium]|nr:peroxiredoxin [Rhodocyclaceae bacterium]
MDTTLQPPPFLYDEAPDFEARSTQGTVSLKAYRGKWVLLFSHPADFTPVCTSELIAFARHAAEFSANGCELLALSVDGLYAHLAWLHSIQTRFGIDIPFPLIEDPSMAIAKAYGMLPKQSHSSVTVRGAFLIDPEGLIRSISWYPISTGRSVREALRSFKAIKLSYEAPVYTPAEWESGQETIIPPPRTMDAAKRPLDANAIDWYYRTCPDPSHEPGRKSKK